MLSKLNRLVNQFYLIGVHDGLDEKVKKITLIHNRLSVISIILTAGYPPLLWYFDLPNWGIIWFLAVLPIILGTYFNFARNYTMAKYSAVFSFAVFLIIGILMYGLFSGFEFGFTALFCLLYLYFPKGRERIFVYIMIIILSVISVSIIYFFDLFIYSEGTPFFFRIALFTGFAVLINSYLITMNRIRELFDERNKSLLVSLQSTNDELERFNYSVAHDLKQPLRTIHSFSQLLKKHLGENFTPQAEEYFNQMLSSVGRMDTLLNDLLKYSRIDSVEMNFEEVDLRVVFNEVVSNLNSIIEETGAKITHDSLPVVQGIKSYYSQLFQNLIYNAIIYAKENVAPNIHINVSTDQEDMEITFRDNGIGIEKEHQKEIFTIFKRLHTNDSIQGSGLGLASCIKILNKLGGEIKVESQLGIGSSFIVSVPRIQAA